MTSESVSSIDAEQQDKRRRRKALLAGGLVLGLGAAVTLAAWSDGVFANGLFRTGTFELQGNTGTDQTAAAAGWNDYDVSPGGTLQFNQSLAEELVPNETSYAPFAVKLSDATTADADYQLVANSWADDADPLLTGANVTYVIYAGVPAASCNADGVAAATPWYEGSIGTVDGQATRELLGSTDPNTVDTLCFGVTLNTASEAEQNAVMGAGDSRVIWEFTAESK